MIQLTRAVGIVTSQAYLHPPVKSGNRAWCLSFTPSTKNVVFLPTEPTIQGGFLLSLRLALCYRLSCSSKQSAILQPFKVARNCVDNQTVAHWSQFFHKAMSNYILMCSLHLILMEFDGECGHGNFLEIVDSCFRRQKCNWSMLCKILCFLVRVQQELGHLSCACHWSFHWGIAIIKSCILPSTTFVSDCWSYNFLHHNDGLTHDSLSRSVSFVAHGCSQIRSRPHGCTSSLPSGLTEKTNLNLW